MYITYFRYVPTFHLCCYGYNTAYNNYCKLKLAFSLFPSATVSPCLHGTTHWVKTQKTLPHIHRVMRFDLQYAEWPAVDQLITFFQNQNDCFRCLPSLTQSWFRIPPSWNSDYNWPWTFKSSIRQENGTHGNTFCFGNMVPLAFLEQVSNIYSLHSVPIREALEAFQLNILPKHPPEVHTVQVHQGKRCEQHTHPNVYSQRYTHIAKTSLVLTTFANASTSVL